MENVSDKINSIMLNYKYSSWPLIQGSCLEEETGGEIIEEVVIVVRYRAWPKPWISRVSWSLTYRHTVAQMVCPGDSILQLTLWRPSPDGRLVG